MVELHLACCLGVGRLDLRVSRLVVDLQGLLVCFRQEEGHLGRRVCYHLVVDRRDRLVSVPVGVGHDPYSC